MRVGSKSTHPGEAGSPSGVAAWFVGQSKGVVWMPGHLLSLHLSLGALSLLHHPTSLRASLSVHPHQDQARWALLR